MENQAAVERVLFNYRKQQYEKDVLELVKDCEIYNALIISANLEFSDHSCFVLDLTLQTHIGICGLANISLGHTDSLDGWEYGIEYIMRVMDIVDVKKLTDLVGKYVRVASQDRKIKAIGHIAKDKWFSPELFCKSRFHEEE